MHKKVVVFGGGTGLPYLLKGLKEFPVDLTAIISVADNGKSTGKISNEFNIPGVGDIRRAIVSLSDVKPEVKKLVNYRFSTYSDLDGQALGNLILVGMYNITGSLKESIMCLSDLLDIKSCIYPLTEDRVVLMAETVNGNIIEGEAEITANRENKKRVFYKKEPTVLEEVTTAIKEADLLIFSMGSLFTSVLSTVIPKKITTAIKGCSAKIMYVCNVMTQPGETDGYLVSDHINAINAHLDGRKVDVVIASNSIIPQELIDKYHRKEEKEQVLIDYDNLKELGIELIESDLLVLDENTLKHNSLVLSTLIFSYMMRR